MIISKNIIGTIDVDTNSGTIWINAPNCILRVQGLDFGRRGIREKFSMIDISGNKASMIEGDLVLDDKSLVRFILDLFNSLSYNVMNGKIKDKNKFLDDLCKEINRRIDEQ